MKKNEIDVNIRAKNLIKTQTCLKIFNQGDKLIKQTSNCIENPFVFFINIFSSFLHNKGIHRLNGVEYEEKRG